MAKLNCIIKTLLSKFNVCTGQSFTREFPDEMVADIVSRIPIKTIARCKRVCKRWRRILSEPYFAHLHLSRSPEGLLTCRRDMKKYDIFKLPELDGKSDHHAISPRLMSCDTGFSFGCPYLVLCGSVNGLICLWKHKDEACVFNIVTRECIRLPVHEYIRNYDLSPKYGFGFVKAGNEYKVICFCNDNDSPPTLTAGLHKSWCWVYTLGTGMWRNLGQVPFLVDPGKYGRRLFVSGEHYWYGSGDGIFVNGNLHWLVYDQEDTNHEKVCTFDMKKEVIQLTSCPQVDEKVHYRQLGKLRECYCVCDTTLRSELAIWVMKDYGIKESWSKEIVIQDQNPGYVYGILHSLTAFEDGTILLSSYSGLLTYDPRNKTFKRLNFFETSNYFSNQDVAVVLAPSFIRLKSFMLENVLQYSGILPL